MMYPPYGYPPYHSPPLPQQPHHSPPIVDPASKEPAKPDTRDEEHRLALAKQEQEHQRTLVKLQSYEDAKRLMEEKALQDERERYAAMVLEKKRLEKEKADWEASIAKTEAERALKEQISAAEKKVKEAADVAAAEKTAKLKAEHDKAIEEAKKKAAELEAAKKTLEEEAKKNAPDPDSAKAPIIFKDALGRKFNFPYGVCKTWKVSQYVSWSGCPLTESSGYACAHSSSVCSCTELGAASHGGSIRSHWTLGRYNTAAGLGLYDQARMGNQHAHVARA